MTEPLYRIGEAARLLELETYVLRFWESEFPQLEPLRTPKGQRLYTATHLELLRRVKTLLYEDGLTIDGARKALVRESDSKIEAPDRPHKSVVPDLPKRLAKPSRLVQGTLLPKPVSVVAVVDAGEIGQAVVTDPASRRLLQELHSDLTSLLELARAPLAASKSSIHNSGHNSGPNGPHTSPNSSPTEEPFA